MYCPNRFRGCKDIIKYGDLDEHLKDVCGYQMIHCTKNPSCECFFLRNELQTHLKSECKLNSLCPCCNEVICSNDHNEHILKLQKDIEEAQKKLSEAEEKFGKSKEELMNTGYELMKKNLNNKVCKRSERCFQCHAVIPLMNMEIHKLCCLPKHKPKPREVFDSSKKRLTEIGNKPENL